jgi:hypothetical protein
MKLQFNFKFIFHRGLYFLKYIIYINFILSPYEEAALLLMQ